MSSPDECDEFVTAACAEVALLMSATGLPGERLRESKHLDPMMKSVIGMSTSGPGVSKKFASDAFRGLGAVDVVVDSPPIFMELKWSYDPPGKVFESVWDAVKLSILGPEHGREHLYIATGASRDELARSDSADLFEPAWWTR